jgi:predicted CXXCH cytochrome family protein
MKQSRWKINLLVLILAVMPSLVMAADYVGSNNCATCHKEAYDKWKITLHNKSQQDLSPTNDPVVVEWKGILKLKGANVPEYTVKLSKRNGEYYATLVDTETPATEATYKIVRTYGGWGWKQRYQVKIGNMHYILPIQWNQATSRWVAYNPQWWYTEKGILKTPPARNSFELDCAGCHNTGMVIAKGEKGVDVKYSELNTGCEKCHGPGSDHMNNPKPETIINPKKLSYERYIESCGQCHSRGVSKPAGSFGYPWNDKDNKPYIVGEPLDAYYQFRPVEWGGMQAHAKSHHQQWHDLLRSKHAAAKVTCTTCHDPHGGPNHYQLVKPDNNNDLCLACHGKRFSSPEAVRKHTKHPYAPETTRLSRCSSCHMVMTASSAEAGDVHSHDFKIIKPAQSLADYRKDPKIVAPNSCNTCHKEWGKDEKGYIAGEAAYEKLFQKKP